AGEIHTAWRQEIMAKAEELELPVDFTHPVLDHPASDDCGCAILGAESEKRWRDHKAAKINSIRTRSLIQEADIVVARFDDDKKYRQWNAAFDAGFAAAVGTSLITLHGDGIIHPLKEVDAAALAVAASSEEVAHILKYVIAGELPPSS
ncbi:MAG: YtoQ family protein, partial [Acidobacteriota bacterium]